MVYADVDDSCAWLNIYWRVWRIQKGGALNIRGSRVWGLQIVPKQICVLLCKTRKSRKCHSTGLFFWFMLSRWQLSWILCMNLHNTTRCVLNTTAASTKSWHACPFGYVQMIQWNAAELTIMEMEVKPKGHSELVWSRVALRLESVHAWAGICTPILSFSSSLPGLEQDSIPTVFRDYWPWLFFYIWCAFCWLTYHLTTSSCMNGTESSILQITSSSEALVLYYLSKFSKLNTF